MRTFKPLSNTEPLFLTQEFVDSIEMELGCKVGKVYLVEDKIHKIQVLKDLPFGNFWIKTHNANGQFRVTVSFSGRTIDHDLTRLGRFFHSLFGDHDATLHFNSIGSILPALQGLFDLWDLFQVLERTNREYNKIVNLLRGGVNAAEPQLRMNNDDVEVSEKFIKNLCMQAASLNGAQVLWNEYSVKWINDMYELFDSAYL